MPILLELYNYLKDNTNIDTNIAKNIEDQKNEAQSTEQQEIQAKQKAIEDFNASKKVNNYIYFDDVNKKFAIPKVSLLGKVQDMDIYNYTDIIDFELLEDGSSIAKGGLGRALVGGALLGETGAIVGGITGQRKSNNICTSLKIKITLNNIDNPVAYINFITTKTKKSSFLYKDADKFSQEILSILDIITKQIAKEEADNNLKEKNSSADEIKKYKELLDNGAITQEEYDAKKKQLLGL